MKKIILSLATLAAMTATMYAQSGNVGIGTTTPHHKLDLGPTFGTTATDAAGKKLAVYDDASGTDFYGLGINGGALQFHAASTPTEAPGMVLSGTGNVGVGNTNPGSNLTINGSFAAQFRVITATTYTMANDDYYLLWSNASTGTITLPVGTASANIKGRVYIIRNNTPGTTLIINTQSGESTSLGATLTVPYNGGVDLMNTGAASGTTWDVMQFRSSQTTGALIHAANLVGTPVTGSFDTVSVGVTNDVHGCADTITSIRPVQITVTAAAYATHNPTANSGQGEFILTIDGTPVTTAYYSSVNVSGGLTRLPIPGTITYTAVLPAGTHILKLQIKPWTTVGSSTTYHMYNIDAVSSGYSGAVTNADRDAIKPAMMVTAYTQ